MSDVRVIVGFASCMCLVPVGGGAAQAPPPRRVLVPTFAIGADPQEDLARGTFGTVGTAAFGPDSSIYVVDASECTVKHFTKAGRFIRRFGRSGGGPGEFGDCRTLRMSVGTDGIRIVDPGQNRVVRFSLDGRTVETRALPAFEGDIGLYRSTPLRFGYGLRTDVGSVDASGRLIFSEDLYLVLRKAGAARTDTIARYRQGVVQVELSNGRGTTASTGLGYGGGWTTCGDSAAVFADGYSGTVTWYSLASNGLSASRSAQLGITGATISADEQRALLERIRTNPRVLDDARRFGGGGVRNISSLPNRASVLWTVRCMSDGAVWVGLEKRNAPSEREARTEWTVFPWRGPAYTVSLPPTADFLAALGDVVISRAATQEDVPIVRAFRIHAR